MSKLKKFSLFDQTVPVKWARAFVAKTGERLTLFAKSFVDEAGSDDEKSGETEVEEDEEEDAEADAEENGDDGGNEADDADGQSLTSWQQRGYQAREPDFESYPPLTSTFQHAPTPGLLRSGRDRGKTLER